MIYPPYPPHTLTSFSKLLKYSKLPKFIYNDQFNNVPQGIDTPLTTPPYCFKNSTVSENTGQICPSC